MCSDTIIPYVLKNQAHYKLEKVTRLFFQVYSPAIKMRI